MDRDLADHLAATRDFERAFHLSFVGPLIRRGDTRAARKRRRPREAALRKEMDSELRKRSRRAFRGPVSVSIALFGRGPSAAASVKAYLDCMGGIFYADDRMVEHLFVSSFSGTAPDGEKVYIEIEPLRVYATNFDHACSRLGLAFGEDQRLGYERDVGRDELRGLQAEEEREVRIGRNPLAALDPELAAADRRYRREQISKLRLRQLASGHLHPGDRPGPQPAWAPDGAAGASPTDAAERELPGSFWLPLPGVHGWEAQVERELLGHMARWGIGDLPIDYILGLDLAVTGLAPRAKDLDNLAHAVIGSFRQLAGGEGAEPVATYRVYRREGGREGIRVRLMDAGALQAVHREVFESHLKRLRMPGD
jgi:hypothetical protein